MTLAELLVWLTLSLIVFTWINYFFSLTAETNYNFNYISNSYFALEEYEEIIEESKKVFPVVKKIYKAEDFDLKYWFDIVVLANNTDTAWIVFWAYDKSKGLIAANTPYYSDFVPFYMFLNASQISHTSESSVFKFIEKVEDKSNMTTLDNVFLTKFWASDINSNNVLKIDFVYSVDYYRWQIWQTLQNVLKNETFKNYSYSIVK